MAAEFNCASAVFGTAPPPAAQTHTHCSDKNTYYYYHNKNEFTNTEKQEKCNTSIYEHTENMEKCKLTSIHTYLFESDHMDPYKNTDRDRQNTGKIYNTQKHKKRRVPC